MCMIISCGCLVFGGGDLRLTVGIVLFIVATVYITLSFLRFPFPPPLMHCTYICGIMSYLAEFRKRTRTRSDNDQSVACPHCGKTNVISRSDRKQTYACAYCNGTFEVGI